MVTDFLDPNDNGLVEILGASSTHAFPPTAYHAADILELLRKAGMLSLRTARGFIFAAEVVAKEQNPRGAELLLHLLQDNHGWPVRIYQVSAS